MLETAMECGRFTLTGLRSLIEARGADEASVTGIARLSEALATALPVKTCLECTAARNSRFMLLPCCSRERQQPGYRESTLYYL